MLRDQEKVYDEIATEWVSATEKYQAAKEENGPGPVPYWVSEEYESFMQSEREYLDAAGKSVKGTMADALDESTKNIELLNEKKAEYLAVMMDISSETAKATDEERKWYDAASEAIQGVQGDIDNLAAAYLSAFDEAQKSISNTVGLTKDLSNETDITSEKLTTTWESQIEWINNYSNNLQKAQEYGITDGLITSLSDGSEQSGQYINQIIGELDNLNEKDAKALVKKLNKDFEGVQAAEGQFAKTVADYRTDFDNEMDNLLKKAERTIDSMDLSGAASKAAKATINSYISEIKNQVLGGQFANATKIVQAAVESILTPRKVSPYQKQAVALEEYAKGTKHSADVFLAGEEGPELIVNAEGSQVFTAAETQRILSGEADGTQYSIDVPELIRQLTEDAENAKPTFSDIANDLDSETNNYNSSSAVNHITYSPTYQINGSSNESIMEGIRKADKMSKSEFAKMMREYELESKRTSFK